MAKKKVEKDPPSDAPADDETAEESTTANGDNANAELEARAIAQAMQSADASYVPSPSLLASDDAEPLPAAAEVDEVEIVCFFAPAADPAASLPDEDGPTGFFVGGGMSQR